MNNEVNELLDKLEKLENAPLIWVNKKVYDASKEIERLNNIINDFEKYFDNELKNLDYRTEKLYTQGIHDTIIGHKYKLQELKGIDKE